jgi:hypothetical protein
MRLRATDISSKDHVVLAASARCPVNLAAATIRARSPVRSHKSCRQLPVGILLRFKNGFDNIGLTVAAGQNSTTRWRSHQGQR